MTVNECIKLFIETFPENRSVYDEHQRDYVGYPYGHIFFGDSINIPLTELLSKNVDASGIKKYIDFINLMYEKGDPQVKNIVEVTILEFLGDDPLNLKIALQYFSFNVRKASLKAETNIGRKINLKMISQSLHR